MGSGGVSLLYRREKGKTRMGEGTLRGKRKRLGKRKGGKGKGKGKGRGNGRLYQKAWGLTGGGVFFSNWEKILLQLEKSISDFELNSDAGRMADRSWEEPFISEE